MNRSKGARRVGRRGVKIEKEEKEGIHYGIILWQCVKKEGGRGESTERMRIGLGHSLSFHAAARRRSSYFSFEATAGRQEYRAGATARRWISVSGAKLRETAVLRQVQPEDGNQAGGYGMAGLLVGRYHPF